MHGVNVLHQATEPIRRNAPPEAVMFVALVSADGHLKR
jgi:hypothetical protein